jgi:hypothetical protein
MASRSQLLSSSLAPPPAPQVDFASVLRLFRDDLTRGLVDRQVAALTLVARRNADG